MGSPNLTDYATYLCNVFHDDPEFQKLAWAWAEEEVRHGRALGPGQVGSAQVGSLQDGTLGS